MGMEDFDVGAIILQKMYFNGLGRIWGYVATVDKIYLFEIMYNNFWLTFNGKWTMDKIFDELRGMFI